MEHLNRELKTILAASEKAGGQGLLVGTHNAGKLHEFRLLLDGLWPGEIIGAKDAGVTSPDETGTTFEENALLKARHALNAWNGWVLADDSGLCVDALDGAPGVDTAHFGGWQKLLDVMRDVPEAKRTAHFVAVLVLAHRAHGTWIFRAEDHGAIAFEARGEGGFGYDPVFMPVEGKGRTFAEMSDAEKAKTSHRARAVALLREALQRG
jgi:XTP/dITP diphosphohydrolase